MDEIIWVYVGVIAIIIAFASIGSFLYNKSIKDDETIMENTVNALSNFCNKICQMGEHTRQYTEVKFVSGSLMQLQAETIFITSPEKRYAVHCDCVIENLQPLDLTDAPFAYFDYKCYFERTIGGLIVNCTA